MAARASHHLNLTVVVPSYPPHVHHLEAQLETWARYCADARDVSFDIITRARDAASFRRVLAWLSTQLPHVRVRSLEDLIEMQEPESVRAVLRERVLSNNKYLIQSVKKLLGCVEASTPWCFAVDSETRLLRPMSARSTLDNYLVHRPILYNSRWTTPQDSSIVPLLGSWRCVSKSDGVLLPGRVRMDWWFLVRHSRFGLPSQTAQRRRM